MTLPFLCLRGCHSLHLQVPFCLCKVHITLASSIVIGMARFAAVRLNAPQTPTHVTETNMSCVNILYLTPQQLRCRFRYYRFYYWT